MATVVRYFDLVREMKNAYNHCPSLVESTRDRGIKPTARFFATTVPTHRKWVRRYKQHEPTDLIEQSRACDRWKTRSEKKSLMMMAARQGGAERQGRSLGTVAGSLALVHEATCRGDKGTAHSLLVRAEAGPYLSTLRSPQPERTMKSRL